MALLRPNIASPAIAISPQIGMSPSPSVSTHPQMPALDSHKLAQKDGMGSLMSHFANQNKPPEMPSAPHIERFKRLRGFINGNRS